MCKWCELFSLKFECINEELYCNLQLQLKKNVNDNDENWKYPRTKQMGMEKTRAQLMRAENRRISEWTVEYRFK